MIQLDRNFTVGIVRVRPDVRRLLKVLIHRIAGGSRK